MPNPGGLGEDHRRAKVEGTLPQSQVEVWKSREGKISRMYSKYVGGGGVAS